MELKRRGKKSKRETHISSSAKPKRKRYTSEVCERKEHVKHPAYDSETAIKVRRLDIPDFSRRYKISIRITGDLSQFSIPQFLSSILSLGKIPIGSINVSAKRISDYLYDFSIDFLPSHILVLLTKHEKFSYSSSVFFDEKKGYLTKRTYFLERKIDGREFVKEELSDSGENDLPDEVNKDPVAIFLDLISFDFNVFSKGAEQDKEKYFDAMNPFDVVRVPDGFLVYPKSTDFKDFFSLVELSLFNVNSSFKLPRRFFVKGLFSIFDVVVELDESPS